MKITLKGLDIKEFPDPSKRPDRFDARIRDLFPELIAWSWQEEKQELTLDLGDIEFDEVQSLVSKCQMKKLGEPLKIEYFGEERTWESLPRS